MSDKPSAFRPSKLGRLEEDAAKSLGARFDALKAKTGMTKVQFAKEFKVPGGPSMISQNISGTRPISPAQAKAYMLGFGCSLEEISPALASKLPDQATLPEHLASRLATADEATRKLVEIALYENDEKALEHLTPSLVAMVRGLKAVIAAQPK